MRAPLNLLLAGLVALLGSLCAPMASAPVASAAGPTVATCAGKPATLVVSSGTVHGTAGDDVVVAAAGTTVLTGRGKDLICSDGGTVKAGAGNDRVDVNTGASGGTYKMGQGRDSVHLQSTAKDASLFLYDPGTQFDGHSFTLTNVERHYVTGPYEVSVVGSGGDDWITATGCWLNMLGRYGNDILKAVYDRDNCPTPPNATSARLGGGPGNDRLIGTSVNDVLYGARGHDHADGRRGSDTCRAEVRRRCEGP
jgi:Ca2+-binding RTX toxin-like protein